MKFPDFQYLRPVTLDDSVAMLSAHAGEAKCLAGGQSLLPMLAFRLLAPTALIDLAGIPGLDRIDIAQDGVELGSGVRWRDIEADQRLRHVQPLLHAAVGHVAHYQVRSRGTVGGSLAHADPAAELPAVALACDATIEVAGPSGRRNIAAGAFFRGLLATALDDDEIIVALHLPFWPHGRHWHFTEFSRRRGDFALAGVALWFDTDSAGRAVDPHLVGFGIGDRPLRLSAAEQVLAGSVSDAAAIGRVVQAATAAIDPPDDPHAPAAYRRGLFATLLGRALAVAANRPGNSQ